MLSALIISLVAVCARAVNITAPATYIVGQPFDVSWTALPINNVDTVTIELLWDHNIATRIWAIATVPNNADRTATVTPSLVDSAEQLRIPNGTEAVWSLRANTASSNDTFYTNFTCIVMQPFVFMSAPSLQVVDVSRESVAAMRTITANVAIMALTELGRTPSLSARLVSISDDNKKLINKTNIPDVTVSTAPESDRRRRLVSKNLLGSVTGVADVGADGDYTTYTVSVEVPTESITGGPFVLVLALDNAGATNKGSYFGSLDMTIMDNPNVVFDPKKMFLAYSGRDVSVGFSLCSAMYDNATVPHNLTFWDMNEDVCMTVEAGANLTSTPLYVALDDGKDVWSIGCEPRTASEYVKFGWKLRNENGDVRFSSPFSNVKMFWAPADDTIAAFAQDAFSIASTALNGFPTVTVNRTNGSQMVQPVKVMLVGQTSLDLKVGQQYDLQFETSFDENAPLNVSFEQCTGTNPCVAFGPSYEMAYTYQGKLTVTVPSNLNTGSGVTTNLVVTTPLCGGKEKLTTKINVAKLEPASSSSSSLSAGEIVGIVCAGVLVCGLAAWWLCMRKSSDDRYTKIDD